MARKLEYGHLVKSLEPENTMPSGLYSDEPRIWMEGKDMEGFNAHVSFGFVRKPGPIHPIEGALTHPYDEILVFAGVDHTDIKYLGAEVSVELGEEREIHTFDRPSVILIPKGMTHGPLTVKGLDKPIVHFSAGLAPDYKASSIAPASLPPVSSGSRHGHLIKPLLTAVSKDDKSGMGYMATLGGGVLYSKRAPKEAEMGPGNADQLVWLFGEGLEGMDLNFTWGFYSSPGKWHRGGEAHTHPEAEILCFVGLDPDDIGFLGAELEIGMGPDYERHIFNTPTVAICPPGFPHLPLITRWADKPYSFFVICLSGDHDSPWVEA
jgi:hypothetical protein